MMPRSLLQLITLPLILSSCVTHKGKQEDSSYFEQSCAPLESKIIAAALPLKIQSCNELFSKKDSIRTLDFSTQTKVSNLEIFTYFPNLYYLDLSNTNLENLKELGTLKKLHIVAMNAKQLQHCEEYSHIPALHVECMGKRVLKDPLIKSVSINDDNRRLASLLSKDGYHLVYKEGENTQGILGSGSYGVVYLVSNSPDSENRDLEALEIAKFPNLKHPRQNAVKQSFLEELNHAKKYDQLNEQSLPTKIYNKGSSDYYLIKDFIAGKTLREWVRNAAIFRKDNESKSVFQSLKEMMLNMCKKKYAPSDFNSANLIYSEKYKKFIIIDGDNPQSFATAKDTFSYLKKSNLEHFQGWVGTWEGNRIPDELQEYLKYKMELFFNDVGRQCNAMP